MFIAMFFLSVAAGSMGLDYDIDSAHAASGLGPEKYCYNYTFIDNSTLTGSLLHDDLPDETLDLGDPILYDGSLNLCRPGSTKLLSSLNNTENSVDNGPNAVSTGDTPVFPNPQIAFIEDGKLTYDALQSRETIFYGGVLPFIALPDTILDNNDHFFNQESFSLFLYFKRKF